MDEDKVIDELKAIRDGLEAQRKESIDEAVSAIETIFCRLESNLTDRIWEMEERKSKTLDDMAKDDTLRKTFGAMMGTLEI